MSWSVGAVGAFVASAVAVAGIVRLDWRERQAARLQREQLARLVQWRLERADDRVDVMKLRELRLAEFGGDGKLGPPQVAPEYRYPGWIYLLIENGTPGVISKIEVDFAPDPYGSSDPQWLDPVYTGTGHVLENLPAGEVGSLLMLLANDYAAGIDIAQHAYVDRIRFTDGSGWRWEIERPPGMLLYEVAQPPRRPRRRPSTRTVSELQPGSYVYSDRARPGSRGRLSVRWVRPGEEEGSA